MSIHTSAPAGGHRFIVHGLPGVGKTHLAASTGKSIFVPAEMGLRNLPSPVPYTDQPATFDELTTAIREAAEYAAQTGLRHVVVDSLTAVERLVYVAAQQSTGKAFADAIDYGKLWRAAMPYWGRLLDQLDRVRLAGLHVWLLAHSAEEVAADLDTGKTWRRATLSLNGPREAVQGTVQQLVAWADHVLYLVQDLQVQQSKGSIATARVMSRELWTCDVGGAVAKNRAGLPPKIAGEWRALAAALAAPAPQPPAAPEQPAAPAPPAQPAPQPTAAPPEQPQPAATRGMDDDEPAPARELTFAERLAGADVALAGQLAVEAAKRGSVEDLTACYVRAMSVAGSLDELNAIAASCKAEPLFARIEKQRPQACADAYMARKRALAQVAA